MPQHVQRTRRRIASAAGVLGAVGALTLGASAPAHASPADLDPDARGSITIHKLAQPDSPSGLPNNGSELPSTEGMAPVPGVTFDVARVDLDLAEPASWQALGTYTVAAARANLTDETWSDVTGTSGVVTLGDLPVGLYLVTEATPLASGVVVGADPFLVSVPTRAVDGAGAPVDAWNYDVHVYPKNTVAQAPVKTVDDADAQVIDDHVVWHIRSKVPAMAPGTSLTQYVVTDALDPRLTYRSLTVHLGGAPLTHATDYTIDHSGVAVSFTAAGLSKLQAAPGAELHLAMTTAVSGLGDGTITNTARTLVNGTELSSDPAQTLWGGLQVTKHASTVGGGTLEGARFEVRDGDDVVATIVTGADGVAQVALKAGTYTLVETRAPAGYRLDPTPRTVVVEAGTIDLNAYDVVNQRTSAFMLPLTGASGPALFVAGGLGIVALALGLVLVLARQREPQPAC